MAHPTSSSSAWVCAQIGSREHYSIPRVLHRNGRLRLFMTDFWARPGDPRLRLLPGTIGAKLRQRYHPDLQDAPVDHLGLRRVGFDIAARLRRLDPWQTILRRDRWFQERLLARRLVRAAAEKDAATAGIFFTYSYAGARLMRFFRQHGWRIVLDQIDPGELEQQIVAREHLKYPRSGSTWQPAPAGYWENWRTECALADVVMVNSEWSAEALRRQGIPPEKIRVIPLAYEAPVADPSTRRDYPAAFDASRPLRVLFLGQLNLRKGVHLALEAARRLEREPVEWIFVGPSDLPPPEPRPNVRWQGPVSRADARALYARADVFLLPTLSDGFAITQLEAQAEGLPVLASRFCGDVVEDGRNGLIIDPLTPESIAAAVSRCAHDPALVARLSANSRVDDRFSLARLEENLLALERELAASSPSQTA